MLNCQTLMLHIERSLLLVKLLVIFYTLKYGEFINYAKHLVVENELKKVKTFDSSYFIDKSHFEEVGTQHYLVFQPMYKYFKRLSGVGSGSYIFTFIFANLKHPLVKILQLLVQVISNSIQNYVFFGTKTRIKFNGSCLKQGKITYNHEKVVNRHQISVSFNISDYPTKENCLFGALSLTRNADINKCKYSEYGIGFDRRGFGIYLIIFGVDMSFWSR